MTSATSPSAAVDARIASASEFARPICTKIRSIIRKAAPNLEECLKWGMPAYQGKGLVCCIGAFKQHVTLHFFRGAELKDTGDLLERDDDSANSRKVRITSLEQVKAAPLTALVKQAAKVDTTTKPVTEKKKRPDLPVPPVLNAALKKNARAKKTFDALPPSCRREYSEWIAGAKREETVQRRLEKALVMLAEGRRMNDEYR